MDGFPPSDALTMRQKMLVEIAAGATPVPEYVERLSLHVVAMEWSSGFVAIDFHIPSGFCVEPGVVFGGHVAGIHDQAAGFVMFGLLEDDMVFATTRLNVAYLTATRPGDVRAEAELASMDERSADVRVRLTQAGEVTSESLVTEAIRKVRK
ncbi:PaaI family thioesterase [Actinomadura graeca]|uniref:PaaI family thioesterase n=1 Tax=Actinomadura graeca TaxID=2750812 RepID=A0ABX8QRY1_9ACTN|nr:hotdog domain-containing protein [Actinomadura graeca]QXJ21393.1 PaaI family thioesterase [Actinomadura graeca]